MVPRWIPGGAARDAMLRRSRGGGADSGRRDGLSGVLSFVGIAAMAGATLARIWEAHLGGAVACVLAALVFVAAWWAAYRTRGLAGLAAGISVAALSGYSLYDLSQDSEGGSVLLAAMVFILVGLDQWVLKSQSNSERA
jgi:hypothetical protein